MPQNLTGEPFTTSIELDWDDVSGANRYELEYRVSGDPEWVDISTNPYGNPIGGSLFEITGLLPETSYDVRVRAVDIDNNVMNGLMH